MALPTQDRTVQDARGDEPRTSSRPSEWMTGHLSGLRSIVIEPLTNVEMRELRKAGREVRAFEGLAIEIIRTQMTLALMPPRDDPEALRELWRRERALVLEALSLGVDGHEELRLAAALTRCVADGGDNLIAMLAAALETDCMRLGLSGGRGRTDTPDS